MADVTPWACRRPAVLPGLAVLGRQTDAAAPKVGQVTKAPREQRMELLSFVMLQTVVAAAPTSWPL